jgi:hypothetical protein
MKYILLTFLLLSCNKNVKVLIANESKVNIDSVVIGINNYKHTTNTLKSDSSKTVLINTASIVANHDVVYFFIFYSADSIIAKETIFSNDLGYIPDIFKVKLTDSLRIKEYR